MNFMTLLDKNAKKLNIIDVGLVKLGAMGFALMVAKLWKPLLALDWHWYAVC